MSGGGGFFGFSTVMPELRPEELEEFNKRFGALEDENEGQNEDTFGDLGELEEYIPSNPTDYDNDEEIKADLLEGLRALGLHKTDDFTAEGDGMVDETAVGIAQSLLAEDDGPALLAPADLKALWDEPKAAPAPKGLSVADLEAKLRMSSPGAQVHQDQGMFAPPMHPTMLPAPLLPAQQPMASYANLMTRSEKDFIIRVQMTQLQSSNPQVDDFYYQAYTLKQQMQQQGNGGSQYKVYTARHAAQKENIYTPVSFENTLGKIPTYTVTAPRPLIDISVRRSPTQGAQASRRKIFKSIESAYIIVIALEDLHMEILAAPTDAQGPLEEQRKALLDQLVAFLRLPMVPQADDETLLRLLSIGKTQRLLARVVPLLLPNQLHAFVLFLLRNAPTLDSSIDGSPVYEHINREVMDSIQRVFSSDIKDIAYAVLEGVSVMSADEMNTTLSTKIGMRLVQALAGSGAGKKEVVGAIVQKLGGRLSHIASLDGGWGLMVDFYKTCPKPEKSLMSSELSAAAGTAKDATPAAATFLEISAQ